MTSSLFENENFESKRKKQSTSPSSHIDSTNKSSVFELLEHLAKNINESHFNDVSIENDSTSNSNVNVYELLEPIENIVHESPIENIVHESPIENNTHESPIIEAARQNNTPCKSSVCELLNRIAVESDIIEGSKQKLLLSTIGGSQLVSVDGMDPTIFTLENFNSENCSAIFRFKSELIDSTSGTTPISGTFNIDSHSIAGIVLIEENED